MRTITLTAPSAWASAIVNRNYSGLDPEDVAALNTWLAREGLSFVDCLDCRDAGFRRWHDAFEEMPVAADCQRYVFPRPRAC